MQNTIYMKKKLQRNLVLVVNKSMSGNNSVPYEELKNKIHKHNIKTVTMGFPDLYGRFMGKKFDSEYFLSKVLKGGSAACNYLLSTDLACTPLPNAKLASYHRGFGDFVMKADTTSIRDTDYVNQKREVLYIADLVENDDSNVEHAPRFLLRKSVQNLENLGYKLVVEGDISATFFKHKYKKIQKDWSKMSAITDHNNAFSSLYTQINDEFLNKIKNSSRTSQIRISSIFANDTPGQFSFNFEGADAIKYCDNLIIFKLIAKKLAEDHDVTASFMPKISPAYEGNTASLKISIIDMKTNKNALADLNANSLNNDNVSTNILGGVYSALNDLFVFYNPTVNSYKRLKENKFQKWNQNSFKPGMLENFVGITIIKDNNENKLFFNLTGGDCNPYLSLFALTSSFVEGIQNKINLSQSVEKLNQQKLPLNLLQASSNLEKSQFAKKLLGEEIHFHFSHFYNLNTQ